MLFGKSFLSSSSQLLTLAIVLIGQVPPEDKFNHLKQQLESYDFTVKIEPPPAKGAYGLLQTKTKTIWINPIVFDLEIALPTLIHEATHAAQVCAGNGEIFPLNLSISPPNVARPFFTRYHEGFRRHLEAEAYAVQAHPQGYNMILDLLEKHCENKENPE